MLAAIQVYEVYRSEAEARQGLAFQAEQVGYLGGRVLPPSPEKPGWKMQAFHDAAGVTATTLLPDGMRYVHIPDGLAKALGIKAGATGAGLRGYQIEFRSGRAVLDPSKGSTYQSDPISSKREALARARTTAKLQQKSVCVRETGGSHRKVACFTSTGRRVKRRA